MDMYAFYTGQAFDAHEYLGAHTLREGVVFRTFAPGAKRVSLLLNDEEHPMQPVYDGNFYELCCQDAKAGDAYAYRIYPSSGNVRDHCGWYDHCDPYGFQMELRPAHRSIVSDLTGYVFRDEKWMRSRSVCFDRPLNIYEMHLGSWRRHEDGSFYTYTETAEALVPYLKQAGYNYVELLPVSEHPCDESWGYQNTGFFAPTSRYGSPADLMAMVDCLHQNGIGVILDFVPVHFAVDDYALARYDGTALYEYPDPSVGMSEWGSCNFLHARGEVRSFLQSSANHWLTQYHFDGLRMDAISRIIYWQGDEKRGLNGKAIEFLKVMNQGLKQRHPSAMLIAEDSTAYPGVTAPIDKDGLGFDYKWDMGWMHDTLEYFQLPPHLRTQHYHKLTFSMLYFGNERYLLPYSHDEVVHAKATILQKMNGQYADKFPQARAMYLYMAVHPGKVMHYMGCEIGHLREWDEKRQQDWDLLKYPAHDSFRRFMADLNRLTLTRPALYERDYGEDGFTWLDCHQEEKCLYAMQRKGKAETLAAVFNFGASEQTYALTVSAKTRSATLLLNTEWPQYGGQATFRKVLRAREGVIALTLPPFSGVLIKV